MHGSSPLPTVVFYVLASVTVAGALAVALGRNILRGAFWLLATLAGTAGLYLSVGADFVGLTQVLVYVGGILVLLLFAVLLTHKIGSVRITSAALGRPVALLGGLGVAAGLIAVALGTPWPLTDAVAAPTTARLGDAFLREYLFPFELMGLVLLLALVGTMVLARRASRSEGTGG